MDVSGSCMGSLVVSLSATWPQYERLRVPEKNGKKQCQRKPSRCNGEPFLSQVGTLLTCHCCPRLQTPSLSVSATTCLTSVLICGHTELIHSVVEAVSISQWCCSGRSARSVPGEAGQRISTTLAQFSSTFSPGPMHLSSSKRTISTRIVQGVTHAQHVVVHAHVHEFRSYFLYLEMC